VVAEVGGKGGRGRRAGEDRGEEGVRGGGESGGDRDRRAGG